MTNKGGRPSKYKEEYCQALVEHMREGFTFEAFAGAVGVCVDTLYEWSDAHQEFSEAKKLGRGAQMLTDEKTLKGLVSGKITGSTTAHIFKMKNCHPKNWRDRQEIESVNTNKNIEVSYEDYIKTLGDN